MISIIDGKKYDTEKAEIIGKYLDLNDYYNDLFWYEVKLCITKKGSYFLYAKGEVNFPYPKKDLPWGEETIIPLSREEAFLWSKNTKNTDTILKYFSDLTEEA